MSSLVQQKLAQAVDLVKASNVDVWLTFVRETGEGGDPVLSFLIEGGMTWQSAFLVFHSGRKIAIVGNYDADPLIASGHWDEVVPYVQGIREPLWQILARETANLHPPTPSPSNAQTSLQGEGEPPSQSSPITIGVNFSTHDVKADGLSHGMYLLLQDYLNDVPCELVSAEDIVMSLRGQKTDEEVRRIQSAIRETEAIFSRLPAEGLRGRTEKEVYDLIQGWIDEQGYGYGWARTGNPIVNSGPNSMIGHGIPSDEIRVEPGHIFHIDLGIIVEGYSSDIQRCWYVPHEGERQLPGDVQRTLNAVKGAISEGANLLRPGAQGWQVDEAARSYLVREGYEEYMHALGHQVGRVAHDGGALLGPRWERYGRTPFIPVKAGEVYTLELGVILPNRGYLGLEEIVLVTEGGVQWLTDRQTDIALI
jgi:Xaa-Pro dipeptidase